MERQRASDASNGCNDKDGGELSSAKKITRTGNKDREICFSFPQHCTKGWQKQRSARHAFNLLASAQTAHPVKYSCVNSNKEMFDFWYI